MNGFTVEIKYLSLCIRNVNLKLVIARYWAFFGNQFFSIPPRRLHGFVSGFFICSYSSVIFCNISFILR